MMRRLFILGAGGLATEIETLARRIDPDGERWASIEFVGPADVATVPVVGDDDWLIGSDIADADLAMGVGAPGAKLAIARRYAEHADRFEFPVLVDPSATVPDARNDLRRGAVLQAGVRLTCDIVIDEFAMLNLNCTVGHGAYVGRGCQLNPSVDLAGGSRIEEGVLLGTGATVLEDHVVGAGATVGANALVTKSVEPGVVVVGVPARPLAR